MNTIIFVVAVWVGRAFDATFINIFTNGHNIIIGIYEIWTGAVISVFPHYTIDDDDDNLISIIILLYALILLINMIKK